MTTYEHRQIAYFLIVAQLFIIALAVVLLLLTGRMAAIVLLAIVIAVACVFVTLMVLLKTRVDDDGVSWAMTFGFPRGFVPFSNITTIEQTKLSLFEGYLSSGVWTLRRGWSVNPGGRNAVTIYTSDGRRITLGTNEPQRLYDAIVERLSKPIV